MALDPNKATGDTQTPEQLQQMLEEMQRKLNESEQARLDLEGKNQDLTSSVQTLEGKVVELSKTPAAAKPVKVKKESVLVISATEYSYDIGDGVKVTPEAPVRAERYEGNLLDSQMKAGYIVVFEG